MMKRNGYAAETMDLPAQQLCVENSQAQRDYLRAVSAGHIQRAETIQRYDAEMLSDGPEPSAYQTERWSTVGEVLTVIRTLAPIGEFEIWEYAGESSELAAWERGELTLTWTTQPTLRVRKYLDGSVSVHEIEPEMDENESRYMDERSIGGVR